MEISGDYLFDVPRHVVWNALQEPKVLEAVLPEGEGFEEVGDDLYSGSLSVKVGPVQGTFQGHIRLYDFKAPESYWMEVNGTGAPGVVNASGRLQLEERGNQTFMTYAGQVRVGGRIASVGQRLIENSARSIIRQSLDALNAYLKVEDAHVSGAVESNVTEAMKPGAGQLPVQTPATSGYEPPAQTTFALNKVRDEFNSMIPAQYRAWVLGGGIVVIVLIIWLIASR